MHKKSSKHYAYSVATISKTFSKLILFLFLTFSTLTFAQVDFDDDVDDEAPVAAIDSGIVILFFTGIALGFCLLKKGEKINN